MTKRRNISNLGTIVCSPEYGVTTLVSKGGDHHIHRTSPCDECPWRKDVPTGVFPPKAFETSAHTAYDMAQQTFACHMSGSQSPATCAGFLVRHAAHNLSCRISQSTGRLNLTNVSDGGFDLYLSYREMAIANGVGEDDECLVDVRVD